MELNISTLRNYINDTGNDCILDGTGALKNLVFGAENTILKGSLGLLGIWCLYFLLEIVKLRAKDMNDLDKAFKFLDWVTYIQRGLMLFQLILIARILQYAVWGL